MYRPEKDCAPIPLLVTGPIVEKNLSVINGKTGIKSHSASKNFD